MSIKKKNKLLLQPEKGPQGTGKNGEAYNVIVVKVTCERVMFNLN